MNKPTYAYIALVTVGGTWVLGSSLLSLMRDDLGGPIVLWAVMALLTLATGSLNVMIRPIRCRVAFSDVFILLSLLICGIAPATLIAALEGFAASSRKRGDWPKRLFNTMGMAISIHCAALLLIQIAPEGGIWGAGWRSIGALALAMIVIAAAHYLVNTFLVSIAVALERGVSPVTVFGGSIFWSGTEILIGSLLATAVFALVRQAGFYVAVPALLIPFGLHFIYRVTIDRLDRARVPSRG
ncbi:MAG: hypothetical protein O7A63_08920 [Acidobacteria bacterium]|nr:hypothetical protein [Acidobacteriota bacterium]